MMKPTTPSNAADLADDSFRRLLAASFHLEPADIRALQRELRVKGWAGVSGALASRQAGGTAPGPAMAVSPAAPGEQAAQLVLSDAQ